MKTPLLTACVIALASGQTAMAQHDSFFDVWTELSIGPSYPASPARVYVAGGDLDGDGLPDLVTHSMGMGIGGHHLGGVPEPRPSRIHASTGAPSTPQPPLLPPGQWCVDSFFDVFVDLEINPSTGRLRDSFFDIFVEFRAFNPGGDGSPLAGIPDRKFHVDSFFDIFYVVDVPNYGTVEHHLHGAMAPGARLSGFQHAPRIDSFFDVFTEISFDSTYDILAHPSPMRITQTARLIPAPVTALVLGCGWLAFSRRRR